MIVREMTSTTLSWVKEISTNAFARLGNRLTRTAFVQRNRKRIALCLLIWLLATLSSYLFFHNAVGRSKKDFYELGSSAAEKLSDASASSLLENDILYLNKQISEAGSTEGMVFAAILDHTDKVVAHTDPELINRNFAPLEQKKVLDTIGKVRIEEGSLPDKRKIIAFLSDITFAGTRIGKAYFALSASILHSALHRYRTRFILSMVLCILLLSGLLVIVDQVSMARALERQKQMEGIMQMGPYMLREKIAQGGMAEVFLADCVREDGFRKALAIKRVLPHLAQSPNFIKMFTREARLAALLQHPNIVQIFDFGKVQDFYFIAMEYIPGRNLAQIMAKLKEGFAVDQAVFVISQICMGLEYSHSRKDEETGGLLNIVHRDISPQNILISMEGEVKLSDFGISKANAEPSLTEAGVIRGKFSYLSPEQALGEAVDHRTDIFALGIVFHEILSGGRLFRFNSDVEAMRSIPEKRIMSIKELRPDIPDEVDRIVMKCLEKDKTLRYQKAQETLDDLRRLRQRLKMTFDRSNLSQMMKSLFNEKTEPE
jgi:uncharacterized membrane protein affecting hemolysin expression